MESQPQQPPDAQPASSVSTITLREADALLTGAGQPHEVVTESIRGIPTRVWKNAPRTLRDILLASREHGSATYLVFEDERLSFAEHFDRVAALATHLVEEHGVAKGDRVAIAMRNYPEWAIAFWAATAVGAIVVPLNAWWNARELEYGLADSITSFLFADRERFELLGQRLEALPELRAGIVTRGDRTALLPDGWRHWDDLRYATQSALPLVELEPEDDATIFYTSGTTGFPKGALGTHRNICSNYFTLDFLRARGELRSGVSPPADLQPASLLSVPLFHVTGCHSTLVPALAIGAKLVLVYKFDAEETVRLIERERITSFGGVPTLVWRVLESEALQQGADLSSVLRIGYGGAPAAPELVARLRETFPDASPSNGYGLTETSSVTSANAGDDYVSKPWSVGTPVPVCAVKVVSEEGRELPVGEVGELWISGPNIVKGYWNNPAATAETFTDGWLHSGDLARLDDDGCITIVDRAKDMVIRGGENIYCVEVESALHEHSEVIAAAAFGVPHRTLGEEVGAAIQLRRGASVSAEALAAFAAERISAFKVPVHWEIGHAPFPLNPNGKVMKSELRATTLERLGIDDRAP